uniref:Yippee domain-containing protein n=1 Tax=Chlamydomonas leiostraca TaxID=1034604 RepID=A0A7S0WYM1_9CHLO|mmetsp:Transcript_35223/g.89147  ORF Transcript_35223/g.89147 Transcript_35223/m.89147 type:complete len:182 (+) Transcript_35223:186-731(+)|eukprot:CAMPEP_0202863182 /NCGR_PEP_ID=MMETSP1391-20130828/3920_1 /ASSEMBLY_ACC=CAM_ASM_000867 /TAXON_ID=1034604 /ORGANISM="Chlamydomonas leiostraca, Strain SAG 11-49" /LENGTH=181 /DNA_ID=CAMNT_0049542793 /DNA_START=162 /DNA_END=707 /DNA_ORIENTATION=-
MGRPFRILLNNTKVYSCASCRTHLACQDELVSKQFHSKSGRAYLFNSACNTTTGPQEERMMTTGMHIVCDVYCVECMACVGWQYLFAYEKSQKYKEGKVVLERLMLVDFERTSQPAPASLRSAGSSPQGSAMLASRSPSSDAGSMGSGGSGRGAYALVVGAGAPPGHPCWGDYTSDEDDAV